MKYIKTHHGYFGRLEKGEEVLQTLTDFCTKDHIKTGKISLLGAVCNCTLGYYSVEEKKYHDKTFTEDYELTSGIGNISLFDGNPMLHIHVTIADSDFHSWGGHLKSAIVSITCEFVIEEFDVVVERKFDEETGLNLIDF